MDAVKGPAEILSLWVEKHSQRVCDNPGLELCRVALFSHLSGPRSLHDDGIGLGQLLLENRIKARYFYSFLSGSAAIWYQNSLRIYCQIWCLRLVGHAAIWSGFVASIPSLNVTPVITLAR